MLYKVDLARAFRQITIDPLDVAYLGVNWRGNNYIDTALPFGFRHRSAICQRITDAVQFILEKHDIKVVNYIDDFIAIVPASEAFKAFEITKSILLNIGLVLSDSKTIKPAYQCNCLGIVIDTLEFSLSIRDDKLKSILGICKQFQRFNKLRKQQIQSILGLLIFLHKAIKPAVSIFQTFKGSDKVLQAIARNIWLLSTSYDINLICEHIPGESNEIADLLSRWHSHRAPVAKLYQLLNDKPQWYSVEANNLLLDWII
jgi:hypothetical protein